MVKASASIFHNGKFALQYVEECMVIHFHSNAIKVTFLSLHYGTFIEGVCFRGNAQYDMPYYYNARICYLTRLVESECRLSVGRGKSPLSI